MSEDAMREAIARRLADYDALYPLTDAEWEAMRDVGAGDYFGQADAVLAAEVTADRLKDAYERYYVLMDGSERDYLSHTIQVLEEIANGERVLGGNDE